MNRQIDMWMTRGLIFEYEVFGYLDGRFDEIDELIGDLLDRVETPKIKEIHRDTEYHSKSQNDNTAWLDDQVEQVIVTHSSLFDQNQNHGINIYGMKGNVMTMELWEGCLEA